MSEVVIILFLLLILLWTLSRLLTWCIQWYLKRLLDIDVKISKVGFFSLKNLHLALKQGVTVQIETVWLTSSYFNQNIRKPLAICLYDVRIQTPAPSPSQSRHYPDHDHEAEYMPQRDTASVYDSSDTQSHTQSLEQRESLVAKVMTFMQYISIQVENVTIVLLRSFSPAHLIHLKTELVSLELTLLYHSYQARLEVISSSCKALKTTSEESTNNQCQAELQVGLHADVLFDRHHLPTLQMLQIDIKQPNLKLTEGFLTDFRCNWNDAVIQKTDMKMSTNPTIVKNLLKMLPTESANFSLTDLDVEIMRETKQRLANHKDHERFINP